ncbi:MAG: hypothetical protein K0A89_10610 [ANME-2 cluster archaeon]|nr:hypothetical protein [ANME-2 cluster archaeon]
MSKKDACTKIMEDLFGPASAKILDSKSEDEVVDFCKSRVTGLLGKEKAAIFDKI